jgi:hypothetical protein
LITKFEIHEEFIYEEFIHEEFEEHYKKPQNCALGNRIRALHGFRELNGSWVEPISRQTSTQGAAFNQIISSE